MKHKNLKLILLGIAVMLFSMASAWAQATFNLATASGTGTGWSWSSPILTVNYGDITITGTVSNGRRIVVNGTATITLSSVSITGLATDQCPLLLNSSANLTFLLADATSNYLSAGSNCAGIQTANATLTINGVGNGTGSLTARGGDKGAGIGGGSGQSSGSITINSGTVSAYGGNRSAGIGGGGGSDGANGNSSSASGTGTVGGSGGNITINGGSIYASGGGNSGTYGNDVGYGGGGASIGGGGAGGGGKGDNGVKGGDGGVGGSSGTVTINNGTISASRIGGGGGGNGGNSVHRDAINANGGTGGKGGNGGSCSAVFIYGGNINSGNSIGGGYGGNGGRGGNGGPSAWPFGGKGGNGGQGGNGGSNNNITVANGIVYSGSLGIGGGSSGSGGNGGYGSGGAGDGSTGSAGSNGSAGTLAMSNNAIVFAPSVPSSGTRTGGILISGNTSSSTIWYGTGTTVTMGLSGSIPYGYHLTIPNGKIFQVASGVALTNSGTITIANILNNSGSIANSGYIYLAGTLNNLGSIANSGYIYSAATISTASPLPNAFIGCSYSQILTATNSIVSNGGTYTGSAVNLGTITWNTISGSLPPALSGISGSGTSKTITGTPTTAGNYNFTIRTSNAYGDKDKSFSITVTDIPTISFNANGGTVTPPSTITGCNGRLTSLPTPTLTNYKFNGWFTTITGGTQVTTSTVFSVNTTIYAQWTAKTAITINETPQSFVYNGSARAFTVTSTSPTGLSGFTVSYSPSSPINADSYNVTITRPEDATYAAFSKTITAGLVINPAAVTVTATAKSKVYNAVLPTLDYTTVPTTLISGNTFSGALATTATQTSNVGTYPITQGTLNIASGNYTITYNTANLTITALGIVRPTVTGTLTYNGNLQTAGIATNPAAYTITGNTGTNASTSYSATVTLTSTNYEWTIAPVREVLSLSWSIGTKPLTINGFNITKEYDGNTNVTSWGTLTFAGLIGSQTSNVSFAGVVGSYNNATVGTAKPVTYTGTFAMTGGTALASNYSVTQPTGLSGNINAVGGTLTVEPIAAVTYTGTAHTPTVVVKSGATTLILNTDYTVSYSNNINAGTANVNVTGIGGYAAATGSQSFVINPKALTITANAHSITYGAPPSANGVVYDGFVATENETVLTGTLSYTYSYSQYGDVGNSYTITPAGLTSNNYAISFLNGTLIVNPLALTFTTSANNKEYDGNTIATIAITLTNIQNSDDVSASGIGTFVSPNVANSIPVHAANISLSGAKMGNYTIASTATTTANITVAPVTVSAEAKTKMFGSADPALTYTFSPNPLIAGNSLTGNLTRDTGEDVGNYAINQGSVSAGNNYLITYFGADLTITALPTFTVIFDANGGSGTMANQIFTQGVAQNLTPNAFTNGGSVFTNWNTTANGTGTTYTNTQSITVYANMTLFAQWAVGINENTTTSFQIYPNPAQTHITIQINEPTNQQINIIDISGRILLTQIITEEKTNVDISTFAKGIYFVRVGSAIKKLVVQ